MTYTHTHEHKRGKKCHPGRLFLSHKNPPRLGERKREDLSCINRSPNILFNRKNLILITQNALPSEWESIEGERMGVVSHHYGQSFLLFGELQTLGDGIVKGNGLMERHVRPPGVMSLVDAAT